MAVFTYRGRSSVGTVSGEIEADSRPAATAALRNKGIVAIEVKEKKAKAKPKKNNALTHPKTYRDLLYRLTQHAWVAFAFVIVLILFTYVVGLWRSPSLFFLAVELPVIVAVSYVLSGNPRLRLVAPFLWIVTALMALGYFAPTDLFSQDAVVELLPACLLLLFCFWLVRAVHGTKREFTEAWANRTLPEAVADIITLWGATLQISLILLAAAETVFQAQVARAVLGVYLLEVLRLIRLASPIAWTPLGLVLLGLTLYSLIRFSRNPYVARDYREILPFDNEIPVLSELIAAVRLPIWLVVVIIGFVKHFVALTWESLKDFAQLWLGRLVLIGVGLVLPTATLVLGHAAIFRALSRVGLYLADQDRWWLGTALTVILVHSLFLLGLALFVACVAPMAVRIQAISLGETIETLRVYFLEEGLPAAQAVGKAFVLFGLVIIAVPMAALLPGGASWGAFSALYAAIVLVLVATYVVWDQLPSSERERRRLILKAMAVRWIGRR